MKKIAAVLSALIILLQFGACTKPKTLPAQNLSPASEGFYSSMPDPEPGITSESPETIGGASDTAPPETSSGKSSHSPPDLSSLPSSPDSSSGSVPQSGGFDIISLYPTSRYFEPVGQEALWNYRNLSGTQKQIYKTMERAASEMTSGMIPLGKCSYPDLALAFHSMKNDHPEYFWLPSGYIYELRGSDMYIAFDYRQSGYQISYLYSKAQRDAMADEIRAAVTDAQRYLSPNMTPYQRELALHNWLAYRVTYDKAAAADPDRNPDSFTVYGALVKGKAICEGYSRAMQLLLQFAGVECSLITGQSQGSGHMWNLVNLNGGWYHLDATWDDSGDGDLHSYFNLTDAGIQNDHTIDPVFSRLSYEEVADGQSFNPALPSCIFTEYNYFAVNGTLIHSKEEQTDVIADALVRAALAGTRKCEFSYADGYDQTFQSPSALRNEILFSGCIEKANSRLPAASRISPGAISCSGVIGSKAFYIRW